MSQPSVSIITVVYNGAQTLRQTIDSVLSQENGDFEYIVIDGGSKDGTLDIIKEHEGRISQWVSEPDKGIYDAMNKGIAKANGKWINFMNAGDRFADSRVLNLFKEPLPMADILYGDAIVEYPTFESTYIKYPLHKIWREMPFCHQACFADASLMKQLKFDTRFKFSADYDFLLRAYLAGKKFNYVDRVICKFDYKEGASKDNKVLSLIERRRSSLDHSFSFWKWAYLSTFVLYARANVAGKKLLGENLTGMITKILRKR